MSFPIRYFNRFYAPLTTRFNNDKLLWKAHREINGKKLQFFYRPISLDNFIMHEVFNDNLYKVYKTLYENAEVIDVGGHIGLYTLLSSIFTKQIKVFEPDERNLMLLELNLTYNNLQFDISRIASAIDGTQSPTTKLYLYGNTGNSTTIKFPFNSPKEITVMNSDINEFLPCDVLKLDIEGSEYNVLDSIQNLSQIRKAITFEVHYHVENYQKRLSDIVKRLTDNGFRIEYTSKTTYNGHIFALRT